MWGFRYGLWRTSQGAYLVNQNGTERAALKWLRAYVNDTLVNTQSITVVASDGSTTISTKGASLNMVAQVLPVNTTIPNVNWTVSPITLATIDANGKLTALADGKVTVTATAWDASGAKGTASITISNQTTGLPERLLADQISVFPNPAANGCFTIDGIEEIQEIEMIDLAGRRIVSYKGLAQSSLQMQVNIPEGMYILNLKSDKFLIQKKISISK
jgi:hypothetical protein